MTVAPTVVDIAVNPGNLAQRMVLWSNGRVDAIGGAPTITIGPVWYDRTDQPVGVALWITNWTTGAGYVLDYTGKFNSLNGAATLGTAGYVSGVPQASSRKYCDWVWDPAGTGKGYVVDLWGQLYAFGGATAPTRTGPRWGHPVCRRIKAQWTPSLKIIVLDQYGGLWPDFAATLSGGTGVLLWPGWDAARDFEIIDWSNGKCYILDLYGGHNACNGAVALAGYRYKNGCDIGRRHYCLDTTLLIFWVIWEGGILYEFTNAAAPTVIAGGGTNEVQKVTITGTPTGGTFTLTFSGQTTAATAFNASAATVQANLIALSNIGTGDVVVTGGPGPGAPYVVTFTNTLASTNVAQMTATSSFTGGSSPTTTVTTTTDGINGTPAPTVTTTHRPTLAWSYSDPIGLQQVAWQLYVYTSTFVSGHTMTDPSVWASSATFAASGNQPSQRGIVANLDLANNTYVLYVRSENYGGVWSAWSSYTWTQNISPPAAPTGLTATADNTNFRVNLSCSCTLGTVDSVTFQYSDDAGVTWNQVRGAEAVPIATTTTAKDYDVRLGVARTYRAFTYKTSPRVASPVSATASATVTNQKYVLTNVTDVTQGGEVFPQDPPEWSKNSNSGVFTGVGAVYPVVVSDGTPKARKQTIVVECDGAAQWALVQALVESDDTLLYRDPFGDALYCRVVGEYTRTQQRRRPYPGETTQLRHNHVVKIPLQEIQPPLILDVGYTIPPGPVTPT